jgi:hypothetical protein
MTFPVYCHCDRARSEAGSNLNFEIPKNQGVSGLFLFLLSGSSGLFLFLLSGSKDEDAELLLTLEDDDNDELKKLLLALLLDDGAED